MCRGFEFDCANPAEPRASRFGIVAALDSDAAPRRPPPPPDRSPRRRRLLAARVLVVAAAVVMVFAMVAGYARRAVVNSDQFANRASVALHDDSVRTLIAQRVTDDVVLRRQADLLAARPLIESAVSGVVGGRAFTGLFRSGVRDVHRAVFDRDKATVTLTVADVGTVVGAALEKFRPSLARTVESTGHVDLLERKVDGLGTTLPQIADRIRLLSVLLPVLCLALAGGALWASPDRRRTVAELGIGAAAAGIVVVVAYGIVRTIAVHTVDGADARAAAGAVWDAFLGDLRTAAWVVAACGAIVAAAAASLVRPVDLAEPLQRALRRLAAEPHSRPLAVLRATVFVAAGLAVILARDAFIALMVTAFGLALIYVGVNALLMLIYRPPVSDAEPTAAEAAAATEARGRRRRRGRRLAAVLTAAGLVAVTLAAFLGSGGVTTAAPRTGACNGHAELCDRPFDQVALPATHNAMSVPLPGWFSAEQERPIADQLEDGIRGLLIDTHYADRLANGRLRTYFGSRAEQLRAAEQDGVSPQAVDAAQRIRDRLGFAGKGTRGMYLCHTFCELGATPLESVLRDLHDFLVTHPDDVVVVINQDYVTPADFVRAAGDAGLADLAYRGPLDGDWPTLREMIDSNQRVVFLAENKAGAAPWYRLAYAQTTEETPYTFPKVADLTDTSRLAASCRANRGPRRAPLFLVNHWISTDPLPRPSDASKVNAYKPLLARMRDCARIRDHRVNLVAVNFYRRGEVFRVVDTLNGVR
jgi:hypothetical protein